MTLPHLSDAQSRVRLTTPMYKCLSLPHPTTACLVVVVECNVYPKIIFAQMRCFTTLCPCQVWEL